MIYFNKKTNIFHLHNKEFSYYIGINPLGILIHLYSGEFLSELYPERVTERYAERFAFLDGDKEVCDENYYYSELSSLHECASNLKADRRGSFITIEHHNNSTITDFRYHSHKIIKGKVNPNGLPHFKASESECETLIITLKDVNEEIYLELNYTLFKDLNVLIRSNKLINKTSNLIKLKRISSLELDIPNKDYEVLSLHGTWANDREVEINKVTHAGMIIDENHGARGFKHNPGILLKEKNSTLDYGEVYGFNLVYSGNFKYEIGLDQWDQVRLLAMLNDDTFSFNLAKNETFETPECVMVYSNSGINKVSQTFHDLIRDNLIEKEFVKKERPILINSWEGFYFDFDTNRIKKLIDEAKEVNIDLVVLDDGWFGKRNADNSSLGDWTVNNEKINLKEVIEYAHSKGMKFGLWVEPEMISYDSDLYRAHPEFALFNRDHKPTLLRHQLVLDLTNDGVVDYVFDKLKNIFDNYPIDYCKWDFNRHLADIGTFDNNNEGEIYHRFILGTYKLLSKFKERYPHILLETCSAGGGRFDLGMLYYSPQIWCSDNTNPYSRVLIQYATNIFYPLSTIGSHVSADKALNIQDKAIVAAFGTFGYELDLSKLSEEDKAKIVEINKLIRDWHHIVTLGDYYAISSPFESNFSIFNIVSKDKKEALVFKFNFRPEQTKGRFIRVKGLDKNKNYFNSLTNDVYKGDFYMNVGINISAPIKEGMTMMFVLKEVNSLIKVVANKKAHAVKREKLM